MNKLILNEPKKTHEEYFIKIDKYERIFGAYKY